MLTYAEMQEQKLKAKLQEDIIATPSSKTIMGQFIMKLFDVRTSAHVQHLQALSYAQHIAIGSFYDALPGLADGIVESWQGIYGELLQYPSPAPIETDAMMMLVNLREWIETNRHLACVDSEIQNEIDSVLNLINSTKYKLTFLK